MSFDVACRLYDVACHNGDGRISSMECDYVDARLPVTQEHEHK